MSNGLGPPKVWVDGTSLQIDRVRTVESPRCGAELRVELPAIKQTEPSAGADLRIELGQKEIRGTVTAAYRVRSQGRTSWRLEGRTSLHATRSPWIGFFLEKKRSELLRLAMNGAPAAEATGDGDEVHPVFAALGESRWRCASHLALLGGQLLLATTDGYVLARPDEVAEGVSPSAEEWEVGARTVPELVLVAMSALDAAQVLQPPRAGSHGNGARRFFLPHAALPSELRAAAAALEADLAGGSFRMRGGPGLDVAPGTWVKVDGSRSRLVTERRRVWSRELGWRIALSGGYPWKRLLSGRGPSAEPAEVLGFDADKGLLHLELTRLGLTVLAGLRADRASPDHFSATLPHPGDRGLAQFPGCAEEIVYMGAPLPERVLSPEEVEGDIEVTRDDNVSYELTHAGERRHRVTEETWEGNRYEFKKRTIG